MLKKASWGVLVVSIFGFVAAGRPEDLPEGLPMARTLPEEMVIEAPKPAPGHVILGTGDQDTLTCDDGSYGRWYTWISTWMAQGWEVPGEFVVTAAWFMTYTHQLPYGLPRHGYIFADQEGLPGEILWDYSPLDGHSWNYPEPGWERIEVDPPLEIPHGERVWVGMNLRAQYPWWEWNRGPYFVYDALEPPECVDIAWGPWWEHKHAYEYLVEWTWAHPPYELGDLMLRLEGHCKVPPGTAVALDIKPGACPNPLPTMNMGVLPTAVLGTVGLHVDNIDEETLTLEGVPALGSAIEDVSRPVANRQDPCDCTEEGPDGFDDLTLKFDNQAIVAALGDVSDGDTVVLSLRGQLKGGMSIWGQDCVVIVDKGPLTGMGPSVPTLFSLRPNQPNPFSSSTVIRYAISAGSSEETMDKKVSLKIYDVSGRLVETLVDKVQQPGVYRVEWDAKGQASGVYFYRLRFGDRTATKKMVVLR